MLRPVLGYAAAAYFVIKYQTGPRALIVQLEAFVRRWTDERQMFLLTQFCVGSENLFQVGWRTTCQCFFTSSSTCLIISRHPGIGTRKRNTASTFLAKRFACPASRRRRTHSQRTTIVSFIGWRDHVFPLPDFWASIAVCSFTFFRLLRFITWHECDEIYNLPKYYDLAELYGCVTTSSLGSHDSVAIIATSYNIRCKILRKTCLIQFRHV